MEIDGLQKGGKGKDQKGKGKGKGKEDKGKGKGKGGKATNTKGDQKDKGGKDQKGGKGKTSVEVCWACGWPGHHSKDCWRARQVEGLPTQQIPASTTQSTVPPSSATTLSIRQRRQRDVFRNQFSST